ncbi:MAG: class I SAM-dependent methyltransferase, partial [Candidatus Diapherotrites archaeon]|nr:class I SAM-dependent methyltransferase [Candidatus Diapherotrites archaeon]
MKKDSNFVKFNDQKHKETWGKENSFSYHNKCLLTPLLRSAYFQSSFKKHTLYTWLSKENLESSQVLVWGCGKGVWSSIISSDFNADVTGVDISSVAVRAATKRAKKLGLNIKFIQSDVEKLPFQNNTFDFTFSTDVFGHVRNPNLALQELYRVTKSGGRAIMFSEAMPNYADTVNSIVYSHKNILDEQKKLGHINLLTPHGLNTQYSPR